MDHNGVYSFTEEDYCHFHGLICQLGIRKALKEHGVDPVLFKLELDVFHNDPEENAAEFIKNTFEYLGCGVELNLKKVEELQEVTLKVSVPELEGITPAVFEQKKEQWRSKLDYKYYTVSVSPGWVEFTYAGEDFYYTWRDMHHMFRNFLNWRQTLEDEEAVAGRELS